MGHHLTDDGDFQSDKHPELPRNVFALHFDDPKARDLIREYAERTEEAELAEDLKAGLRKTASRVAPEEPAPDANRESQE